MGQLNAFFARGINFSTHYFSWVDAYVACGCSKADDNPLLNDSGWKGVRPFYNGSKEI